MVEDNHLWGPTRIQVLGCGHPGEAAWGRAVSSEHSTPTTPDRPQDSPKHAELHGAQLLGAEEAQVGRAEGGQGVQGGLV